MMDGKDLEAEIHPLRKEDGKLKDSPGRAPAPGDEAAGHPAPQTRLSRCRAVAFFLSLSLCLLVVFVVSFVIPCPERPVSQGSWRVELSSAVAYDFLATEDVDGDKIQDVLFLYKKNSGGSNGSRSCADEGFSSPCTFMAAVSGASGSVLWERPAAQDAALAQCVVAQPKGRTPASACVLVGQPGTLLAVDALTGETLWRRAGGPGGNASVLSTLLAVPDLDADGAPDLLVLTQEGQEVQGSLYSGGSGLQLGHCGSLGPAGASSPLLYKTRAGAHYVLLPCASSLCGYPVKGLYETAAGRESPLQKDPAWEHKLDPTTHRLPWRSPGAIRYLMLVPGRAGQDLLLVSAEACVLLDGQELSPRWTLDAAQVFRKPTLGHYKPDTLALAVENGTGSDRQILLLDAGTGSILWRQALLSLPGDPPPASLPTADRRSAFFFWGRHEPAGASQVDPGGPQHSLYLFHPTLPSVLLELANVSAHITAFHVALLEPSRHAACVILTGPAGLDTPGLVSVTKHKVRDLIAGGRVTRLVEGGHDSDQAVRDRFSRLRYRGEA
ncbi:protein FAM234A [Talpa occidentalis]|uniref:protein FAM234A n=1 Tax=Talpa occidentalis TaxID=50954 RepID=UPI00188F47A4|nr:protein FAM234A [Talpa occidentalis]XP_037363747.1 protein FAM234A [Talpa occidentalis]XP_054549876.1 protein FAM234A [Talpa occidentalis]